MPACLAYVGVKQLFGHRYNRIAHSILPQACTRVLTLVLSQRFVTDAELLAGLRRGESSAFDSIFREWYPRLVLIADRIVGERQVAEDLAQEVFLELWRRRESLSLETTVHAYLLQSVRNRSLNYLRHVQVRRRSAPEVVEMSGSSQPADADAVAGELALAIQDAMQSLTPRCREVFQLSREQGLKYSEIATTLGVSVKAVEAQMGKALRVLRERLAPWLPDGETL
jgi:RNA polymerase sigma-70 factor (ECF subfamily)